MRIQLAETEIDGLKIAVSNLTAEIKGRKEGKEQIFLGQIAYVVMKSLRGYTFNGSPPPAYGTPEVSETLPRQYKPSAVAFDKVGRQQCKQ